MRNLKMLVGLAGPEYALSPGDEREFEADEAERLIAAGFAQEVGVGAARDPLDHDGDGRKGGMKGRQPKKPAQA